MITNPSNPNTLEVEADTRNELIISLGYMRPCCKHAAQHVQHVLSQFSL